MKLKIHLFLCLVALVASCKQEDDELDCSLVDCAFQSFSIELIDMDGTNLLANGTYDKSTIIVSKDGNQVNSNLNTSEVLYFEVLGDAGKNSYKIKLNDSETDILELDLSGENIRRGCCGPYYQINTILYNGVAQEIPQDDLYFSKITVIK